MGVMKCSSCDLQFSAFVIGLAFLDVAVDKKKQFLIETIQSGRQ